MNRKVTLQPSRKRPHLFLLSVLFLGVTAGPLRSQTTSQQATAPDILAPGTIDALSAALSHDAEIGDAEFARIHAMQLRAAVYASSLKYLSRTDSMADLQTNFSKLSKVLPSRIIQPDPTAIAPLVDRITQLQVAIHTSDFNRSYKLLTGLIRDLGDIIHRQMDARLASSPDEKFSQYIQESLKLRSLLLSGDVRSAETLARAVLSNTQQYRTGDTKNSLDAENVYDAYDALGRGALLKKDFDAAQKYLILAASTPGNSRLNAHGPNLFLAKSLLDLGYKETVVAFLTSCKSWWTNPKIDLWITQIRQGQTPDLAPYSRARF